MKMIGLFSSDSATLYKKDVFRIMGMQNGFVIHFRYGVEHLSIDLIDFKKAKGSDIVIFFTHGNQLDIPITDREIHNIPLRMANIVDIRHTEDTGLVHVYLKLESFIKCDFNFLNQDYRTPFKWVSEIEVVNRVETSWHERLNAVKGQFINQLFYKIDLFNDKHTSRIEPIYSEKQFRSFYKLKDESSYIVDIAFYDTSAIASENSQKLKINTEDKQAIKINAPEIIEIGARRDNRSYGLFTQSLVIKNGYSYLTFESMTSGDTSSTLPNDIEVPFEIEKNKTRVRYFSLYTISVAISIAYSKLIMEKWDLNGVFDYHLLLHCLFAIIFGLVGSYKLYELFNKK